VNQIKLIECPRDALQGWKSFIPTDRKIEYLNALLRVGFDTLDFGSFVSPKAIPQMADTEEVLKKLNIDASRTKLLAIVANSRGAEQAVSFEQITYLGFPFSVSETFQKRNANSTIEESLKRVEEIQSLCIKNGKQLVIYISMGFGNPYGDEYSPEIAYNWIKKITSLGIRIISLADTVGLATAEDVRTITHHVVKEFPNHEIGVHLHSTPQDWKKKIDAAFEAGCHRFDGALKGIGGCPMAGDELVGNMDTELLINYFEEKDLLQSIDRNALNDALQIANKIFA